MKTFIDVLRKSLQVVRENWISYLVFNLTFFVVYAIGVVLAAHYPDMHMQYLVSAKRGFVTGWLSEVVAIYANHNFLLAALVTFSINFFVGTVFMVTLPSYAVPFAGCVVVAYRLIIWGFIFGSERAFTVPILVLTNT